MNTNFTQYLSWLEADLRDKNLWPMPDRLERPYTDWLYGRLDNELDMLKTIRALGTDTERENAYKFIVAYWDVAPQYLN